VAGQYDLTASGAGIYTIAVNPTFQIASPGESGFKLVRAEVIPATVHIARVLARARRAKRTVTYNNCTTDRQALIASAAQNANNGSQVALARVS